MATKLRHCHGKCDDISYGLYNIYIKVYQKEIFFLHLLMINYDDDDDDVMIKVLNLIIFNIIIL